MLANTYRRQLHERALDQYGYVTTRDAAALGIPPVELRKLAERGGLTHVARGVFRFDDLPHTGREPFMEAVLRVGDGAFLTSDAVLALHDLGLVNPRRIRVGTPDRVRAALPRPWRWSAGTSNPLSSPRSRGIPATTLARALLDSRGLVMQERLVDAAREAVRRGLLLRVEGERILDALGSGA